MKKMLIFTTFLMLSHFFCCAFAKDEFVYNLKTNSAYILGLKYRPFDLSVSNENVVKASVVTDLFSNNSQLVVQTLNEGISYITYKANDKELSIKILVDDKSVVDLLEIDKPIEKLTE